MNPLLLRYLPHLLGAAALVVIGFKVNGWRNDSHELKRIQPAYEAFVKGQKKANERVEKLVPVDDQARRELAIAKSELQNQRAETSRAWGRVAALQETINAETGCPVVRLSESWGLCLAAAAGGDRADLAACQAAGGDGAVSAGGGGGGL